MFIVVNINVILIIEIVNNNLFPEFQEIPVVSVAYCLKMLSCMGIKLQRFFNFVLLPIKSKMKLEIY